MRLLKTIKLHLLWRREYAKARAELDSYSERELQRDLLFSRADIPNIAARMANERLAAHLRSHPAQGDALDWRARAADTGLAG